MYGSHSKYGSLKNPVHLRHEPQKPVVVPDMQPFIRWRAVESTEEFALCTPDSVKIFTYSSQIEEDTFIPNGSFNLDQSLQKATCFDHCYVESNDRITPVGFLGLASGQLLMINRDQDEPSQNLTHFPLLSRKTACLCLRASKAQPVLAAGFLKSASEKPVVVVDIYDNKRYESFLKKTEVATSIDFQNNLAQTFVVGTKARMIHIVDRRNGGSPVRSWTPRFQGSAPIQVTFCPTQTDLLASYSSDSESVLIFDLRKLWKNKKREQIEAIVHSKSTQEFKWTQNSANYQTFWTLHGEQSTLSSWEMRNNEINSPVYSRNFPKNVLSVDPHPSDSNVWVSVDEDLEVKIFDLRKKYAVQFSSSGEIALAKGSILDFPQFESVEESEVLMKRRLKQGYGFNVIENIKLLGEEGSDLRFVWSWIKDVFRINKPADRMNNILASKYVLDEVRDHVMYGLLPKLEDSEGSNVVTATLLDMEIDVHFSPVRESILRLCGWGNDPERFDHLKETKQYDVAAALYLFQFDPEKDFLEAALRAVDILLEGVDSVIEEDVMKDKDFNIISEGLRNEMHMVAITLSGCGKQLSLKDRWKVSARQSTKRLTSPYLRAMINFLLACDKQTPVKDREVFKEILNERKMPVKDRLAFASRFLLDSDLEQYVKGLCDELIDSGDLQGVMIVGMELTHTNLFNNYVNKHSDIQTIALICCYLKSLWGHLWEEYKEKFHNIERKISVYRDILNQWQCFRERCKFDKETQGLSNQKPNMPPSIQACCLICSHPLMSERERPNMGFGGRFARSTPTRKVSFACPKCKTRFPRCCLCLKTFWTSKDPAHKEISFGKKGKEQIAASWFTWCQACHHGGHLSCIRSWFEQSKQCPVAGCECKCFESEHEEFSRLNRIGSNHSPLQAGIAASSLSIPISPIPSFTHQI